MDSSLGQITIFTHTLLGIKSAEEEMKLINHVVQPGENLWSIASRYGISVQQIMRANEITNPNMVFVGTVLQIPVGPYPIGHPTPSPGPGSNQSLERRVSALEREVNQLNRRVDNLETRVRRLET
ncbi:LysM peptidoglycan-binding domain-containing protein [Ammoniphilus resinae]|uniref:LysM repeat protein n=1 Tax=Ammoniphilus resinae TaxID=861532 RepID=A0ABS4GQG5_9BACL|nr:LysM domain-containing protein [Ammoniphilus resinae]MBP1932382.1 LysM repeat protein [Ammoniphilus resinae]